MPARKPLSGRGVAPTGGRGRARNLEDSICFGYCPPNLGCDNRMNFPTLQNVLCLACSPTRSRGSPLPEGAFFWCVLFPRRRRRLPAATHIRPPLTQSNHFLYSIRFLARFSLRAQAQRKAKKRNAKRGRARGNFLKKVSSGHFQKLLGNRRRGVWVSYCGVGAHIV